MCDLGISLQLLLSSPSHCVELSPLNSTCHLLSTEHSILHSHKSSKLASLSYVYTCLLKFCGHPKRHRVVPKFTTAVLPQLFVNVYVDLWFGLLICVMTPIIGVTFRTALPCLTVQTNAVLMLASYSSNFKVTDLWCHTNKSEQRKCWLMFGHILESSVCFKPLYKYSHYYCVCVCEWHVLFQWTIHSLQTLWQNDSLSTASIQDRPVCPLVNTLHKDVLKPVCNKVKSVNMSES